MSIPTRSHKARQLELQLSFLNEIARRVTAALDLPALMKAVMEGLEGALDSTDRGFIMLWDESAGIFRPAAVHGCDFEALQTIGFRAGEGITGKVFDQGEARLLCSQTEIVDAMSDIRPANCAALATACGSESTPQSVLAAPLQVAGRKFGVLVLETLGRPARFHEQDLPFIQTLADLIALAIDRIRLAEQADEVLDTQKAGRVRSEVMAALSHELRTPLAAIKGYSTALLLDEVEWSEEKRHEFLALIDHECDDLTRMITEILDSSLVDVGQLEIEPEPVRLPYLVDEVVDEMQRRTQIHRFVVDFPASFPIVDADPLRIRQVLRNIIDNAIKYSPKGGLVVVRGEVRLIDIVISVADQGVGISPEDLIPLFEKYFRVKSPNGYHVPGTGLGLPLARVIVEAHGGRIWAESTLGQGTIISFSLPRSASNEQAAAED
jgi:K+-sensing histidine kinase KdpD